MPHMKNYRILISAWENSGAKMQNNVIGIYKPIRFCFWKLAYVELAEFLFGANQNSVSFLDPMLLKGKVHGQLF